MTNHCKSIQRCGPSSQPPGVKPNMGGADGRSNDVQGGEIKEQEACCGVCTLSTGSAGQWPVCTVHSAWCMV